MKKIVNIVCLLILSSWVAMAANNGKDSGNESNQLQNQNHAAGVNRFSIGLRGGLASFLPKTVSNVTDVVGGDVLFDLQYTHYWVREKDNHFGLLVGVSVGYAQSGLQNGKYHDEYTLVDPDGWTAQYTISADKITETDRQIQLEIPLMFSMVHNSGIFVNFGPRFLLPMYTPYKQTLENPMVDAYFEKTDVMVHNEVITGLLTNDQLESIGDNKNTFKLNITLGMEMGYEWKFKNNHSLGLGGYINYGVYSMFTVNTNAVDPFIEVTPAIPSVVASQSAMDTWASKLGYVDGGIKIAYHFNWFK